MCRFQEEELDKEGRELAGALQSGTGRLAGFLNQSVGKRPFHACAIQWQLWICPSMPALSNGTYVCVLSSLWLALIHLGQYPLLAYPLSFAALCNSSSAYIKGFSHQSSTDCQTVLHRFLSNQQACRSDTEAVTSSCGRHACVHVDS